MYLHPISPKPMVAIAPPPDQSICSSRGNVCIKFIICICVVDFLTRIVSIASLPNVLSCHTACRECFPVFTFFFALFGSRSLWTHSVLTSLTQFINNQNQNSQRAFFLLLLVPSATSFPLFHSLYSIYYLLSLKPKTFGLVVLSRFVFPCHSLFSPLSTRFSFLSPPSHCAPYYTPSTLSISLSLLEF